MLSLYESTLHAFWSPVVSSFVFERLSYRIRYNGCLKHPLKIVIKIYFTFQLRDSHFTIRHTVCRSSQSTTATDSCTPCTPQSSFVLLFFENALESSKSTLQSLYSCQLRQRPWCLWWWSNTLYPVHQKVGMNSLFA